MTTHFRWPLLAIAGLGFTLPVVADEPALPTSYTHVSADGRFVFVMLSGRSVEEEARFYRDEDQAVTELRELRRVYAQSGLYRNDGSADPLWTVDWYANQVEVASDGVHLVRHGPWPWYSDSPFGPVQPADLGQEAVSFFASGKLLRTYTIGALVSHPDRLQRSVSHFEWWESGSLNDTSLEYTLATKDGNTFVFDLTTGATVSIQRPAIIPASIPAWQWLVLGVMMILAVAVVLTAVVVALWRTQKSKLKPQSPESMGGPT